jgi:hypothetical protein
LDFLVGTANHLAKWFSNEGSSLQPSAQLSRRLGGERTARLGQLGSARLGGSARRLGCNGSGDTSLEAWKGLRLISEATPANIFNMFFILKSNNVEHVEQSENYKN